MAQIFGLLNGNFEYTIHQIPLFFRTIILASVFQFKRSQGKFIILRKNKLHQVLIKVGLTLLLNILVVRN